MKFDPDTRVEGWAVRPPRNRAWEKVHIRVLTPYPAPMRESMGSDPGDLKPGSGIRWERVYGVIDFGGRTTGDVMAEIRPLNDTDKN